MNEESFNVSVRKFLKKVGITSQREIEQAVRAALACSISRCEVMPTFLRNLRTLTLRASSFMIAS